MEHFPVMKQAGAWRSGTTVYVAGMTAATAAGVFGVAFAPQYTALALAALVAAGLFAWAAVRGRGTLTLAGRPGLSRWSRSQRLDVQPAVEE